MNTVCSFSSVAKPAGDAGGNLPPPKITSVGQIDCQLTKSLMVWHIYFFITKKVQSVGQIKYTTLP